MYITFLDKYVSYLFLKYEHLSQYLIQYDALFIKENLHEKIGFIVVTPHTSFYMLSSREVFSLSKMRFGRKFKLLI